MTIAKEVLASTNPLVNAVRCAAVWVACIDQDFSEAEFQDISAALPDRPGDVSLRQLEHYITNAKTHEEHASLGHVFTYIRTRMANESKDRFIELMVAIAASDKRISIGERHALLFLADLVDRLSYMEIAFKEATGLPWQEPSDLSDPAYWEKLAANGSRKNGEKQEGQGRQGREDRSNSSVHNGHDPERIAALAILGLVGDPSQEEIRNSYRRLAALHHPDKYGAIDAAAVAHATKTFQRIQAAYATLRT